MERSMLNHVLCVVGMRLDLAKNVLIMVRSGFSRPLILRVDSGQEYKFHTDAKDGTETQQG